VTFRFSFKSPQFVCLELLDKGRLIELRPGRGYQSVCFPLNMVSYALVDHRVRGSAALEDLLQYLELRRLGDFSRMFL
jgi:hypothetical protein